MLRAASFRAWIDGALDSTFLALLEERNDILGIQFSYLKENKAKGTITTRSLVMNLVQKGGDKSSRTH